MKIQPPRPVAGGSLPIAVLLLAALFLAAPPVVSFAAQGTGGTGPAPDLPYRLQEVAPGVWAALQPSALRFRDSNSAVVQTDDGLLVVDAQADPARVEILAAELQRRFGQPVRWLIPTHWHGDHTQGRQQYLAGPREPSGATPSPPPPLTVAHETWWKDVRARGLPMLEEEIAALRDALVAARDRLERRVDEDGEPLDDGSAAELAAAIGRTAGRLDRLEGIEIPPPQVTFSDRLTLHSTWQGRPRLVELLHLPGHTRGDVVVHLPREKVVVTGDLLDDLPYGGHGYPARWIASLETLDTLPFDLAIPGHGGVLEGREQLHRVLELLRHLVARAEAAVVEGRSLAQAREGLELGSHRSVLVEDELDGRVFDAFVPETFERAYREAKGELEAELTTTGRGTKDGREGGAP